ncbi:MAG: (deoxy)nucleoside triphosphate pyrophosphohydrolase [Alteraurantiacibacter sp.]
MENFPTWLPVVALALEDADGRVLLQQRSASKHHGGLWEFPGGKVEIGETPRESLVREIGEELGLSLDAEALEAAHFAEENGSCRIVLFLYTSRQECGEPVGREGQAWGWFALEEAGALPLAPMDRRLLARLNARSAG